MAKYVDYSPEDSVFNQINQGIFEAVDLGIEPDEIQKLVEEAIAWSVKELDKEHFEA